jgi:hypothetical protein
MKLTGKMRFRTTWRGKLILQVQYSYTFTFTSTLVCETRYEWRDAKLKDIPHAFNLRTDALEGFNP